MVLFQQFERLVTLSLLVSILYFVSTLNAVFIVVSDGLELRVKIHAMPV